MGLTPPLFEQCSKKLRIWCWEAPLKFACTDRNSLFQNGPILGSWEPRLSTYKSVGEPDRVPIFQYFFVLPTMCAHLKCNFADHWRLPSHLPYCGPSAPISHLWLARSRTRQEERDLPHRAPPQIATVGFGPAVVNNVGKDLGTGNEGGEQLLVLGNTSLEERYGDGIVQE